MNTGIIDIGVSNITSIEKALILLNLSPIRIRSALDWNMVYKKIIFPGVGSFKKTYDLLIERELKDLIINYCVDGGNFLGICLGMQLLFDVGLEGGISKGIGLINGEVNQICPYVCGEKIPHNGWNEVHWSLDDPLRRNLLQGKDFYFNHSYSVHTDEKFVLARTPYGKEGIISAVRKLNMWGTQFHPEKSQIFGLTILKNFIEYND